VRNEGIKGSAPYECLNPTVTPIHPFLPDVREQPIKTTRASIESQSRQPRGVGHINLQLYRSAWSMWNHGGTSLLSILWAVSSPPLAKEVEQTRETAQNPGGGTRGMSVYPAENTVLACGGRHCALSLAEHYSLR
jgi:hypothetical protein